MNLKNENRRRIFAILDKVDFINQSIARHKVFEEPDFLAIQEYERFKDQLIKELQELLAEMDVKFPIAA